MATIIWMRSPLTEAVDVFSYGKADAEKRFRACLAPNVGCVAMKGGHQMPYENLRNSASRLSASD
jgi:hypothetical protein